MIDLLDRPLIWIPVRWPGLKQVDERALAEVIEHDVEIQVEILDREEFDAWIKRSAKDAAKKALDLAEEVEIFRTVAKGWRKVGIKGRSVPFDDLNIPKMLRFPGFASAFGGAYMDAWRGRRQTREGNSAGSPANGLAGEAQSETTAGETSSN